MDWIDRYRLSLRFASFYESEHRYDIVHEAWIYYKEKTGYDLFEIELDNESSYLYTVIKKAFYRWNYHERRGEKYQYFPTDVLRGAFDAADEMVGATILQEAFEKKIALQAKHIVNNRVYETPLVEVFRLKALGHTQTEIAKDMGLSKQLINQYVKKIEEMIDINNPFNGSKVKIRKKISEPSWDNRKDKEDFELYDENEYLRLFIHKESKEGWLVVNKNPQGAEFYIKRNK
jgi:hypothetical protein